MNYKEENIQGTKYRRCYEVHINNNFNQVPICICKEEEVLNINNNIIINKLEIPIIINYTDIDSTFPLLDPSTGEIDYSMGVTTNITNRYIHQILYSMYMYYAKKRDENL